MTRQPRFSWGFFFFFRSWKRAGGLKKKMNPTVSLMISTCTLKQSMDSRGWAQIWRKKKHVPIAEVSELPILPNFSSNRKKARSRRKDLVRINSAITRFDGYKDESEGAVVLCPGQAPYTTACVPLLALADTICSSKMKGRVWKRPEPFAFR